MILAVDVGNSNIVIGGVRDQDILFEARLQTDANKTSDEYGKELKSILNGREVEGAIISSVVPQVVDYLRKMSPVWKDLEAGRRQYITP